MNSVQQTRLVNAFSAYRINKDPRFDPHLRGDLTNFFRLHGVQPMGEEEVVDFWVWFCNGKMRPLASFTTEEVLWGVERFIDEYAPIDDDRYEA